VRLLHAAGHQHVVETSSAGDAVFALQDTPPQVLALDLSLPDRDGLEVAAAVRRGGYTGTVLVVSSDRSDAILAAARQAQAIVLHKPVTADALYDALHAHPDDQEEDLQVADVPAVLLPSAAKLRSLLSDILGGEVQLSPGAPVLPRPNTPAAVAVYVRPRLQAGAVLVADVPMALALGSSVGLGTAESVRELVESGVWPSWLTEDLHECAGVLANAFTLRSTRSLQLYSVHAPGDRLDPLTAAAVSSVRPRLDVEVQTPHYGVGRLSLVTPTRT
jgi:CheY-like chemotaxis protein